MDKVGYFGVVEGHEFVDFVLGGYALVWIEVLVLCFLCFLWNVLIQGVSLQAGNAVMPIWLQPRAVPKNWYKWVRSLYWLEVVPLDGMFAIKGTAPPSSRKFTLTPEDPPLLLDARLPSKKGRRLTAVPLTVPGVRIPGTATSGKVMPGMFGLV